MRDRLPVYVVDIIGECVSSMNLETSLIPQYTYGRQIQIQSFLQKLNNNSRLKYPLIALFQDFPEKRGDGYYAKVTIQKIVIACLTDDANLPPKRYALTFKPILYPIYYEFIRQLSLHHYIVENDVDQIYHIKWDRPGTQPDGSGQNEYIDAIEIQNLVITVSQFKTC